MLWVQRLNVRAARPFLERRFFLRLLPMCRHGGGKMVWRLAARYQHGKFDDPKAGLAIGRRMQFDQLKSSAARAQRASGMPMIGAHR
jgi:hypothetical protein